MGEHRAPDDAELHWPVEDEELEEIPTLELGRDEAGRLAWQNMRPPGPETYRAWFPRREHGPAPLAAATDVFEDDSVMSRFASEASPAPQQPVREVEPPMPTPLVGWDEPPLVRAPIPRTAPLAELPLKAPEVSTVAAAATPAPMPFWSAAIAAPLRLSRALASFEARRPVPVPLTTAAPGRSRLERAALLATGAAFGVVVALAFAVAWRPGGTPTPTIATPPASARAGESVAPVLLEAHSPPIRFGRLPRPVVPRGRPALALVAVAPAAAADTASVRPLPPAPVAAAAGPPHAVPAPPASATRASAAITKATPRVPPPKPKVAPPEALATVGRFAAAYNRMDAGGTQAVWPAADRQALVTTFTALREQRLTLSGCRGVMQTEDTASVMCRGTLRYRPRVGDHDTRTIEGTWRFTLLQRADDWVVDGVDSPDGQ
jgi:hypothetical protein